MTPYTSPSQHPGMGAIVHGSACSFRVWAPNARQVSLAGDFNGWAADDVWLWHEGDGFWSADLPDVGRGIRYRYVIDNRGGSHGNPGHRVVPWRNDPHARDVCHSTGNAMVVDVGAELGETGLAGDPFATPAPQDLIVYQFHVGSFAGYGDHLPVGTGRAARFDQVATKLDYIRGLGFNCIEMLPDVENPGDLSGGYAPSNFFAPESAYGYPHDLRRLVKAAHDRGLAVIFDVVYNHASTTDNGLWEFDGYWPGGGVYFEGTTDTPWGARPAHWKREVRDFFLDHARMLFREYRADGIRFDAAHEVQWECLHDVVRGIRNEPYWHNKLLIAEWAGDQTHRWWHVINDIGFDAVWAMNDVFAWRDAADQFRNADPGHRLDRLKQCLFWTGYPRHTNFVRYLLGSHDSVHDGKSGGEPDHRHYVELAGGRGNWHARAKARLGWALNVACPGIPMMFMGAECNHHGYWHPAEDNNPVHRDHRFDWNQTQGFDGEQMLRLVGSANGVRWRNKALRSGTMELKHEDRQNGVIAFKRWSDDGNVVLVVVNLGENEWRYQDYGVHLHEGGRWREIFNSQAPDFGGYELGNYGVDLYPGGDGRLYVNLPKWSVLMFSRD